MKTVECKIPALDSTVFRSFCAKPPFIRTAFPKIAIFYMSFWAELKKPKMMVFFILRKSSNHRKIASPFFLIHK